MRSPVLLTTLILAVIGADLALGAVEHFDLLEVCEAPFGTVLETFDLDPSRDSALTCAMFCRRNRRCRSILVNRLENRCVLNSQRELVDWPACAEPDSLYAPLPPVTTMRESCSTTEDCVDLDSECRDGTCWCITGLSFDSSSNACVETCPNGYGDTFQETLGHVIWGFLDRSRYGLTIDECMADCVAETSFTCLHVEVWLGYDECYLSEDTAITAEAASPGVYRADPEYNLYHRDCA